MKLYHQLVKCTESYPISLSCYHELCNFAAWLQDACEWADQRTHYQGLDEWFKSYHEKISKNLDKFGFVNGKGAPNNDAALWWKIYAIDPVWSPNLVTEVANHHSSAWERNNCLLIEIEFLISFYEHNIQE